MNQEISFGQIVREHRQALDLTQAELARRVGCATVTVRKIEYDALRPSQQIAELLAKALKIPLEERARFVRLARMALRDTPEPSPLPTPPPTPDEIGQENLSGRAIRGYDLGERIGAGGFGAVYRATQPIIEREVAIKIILPQYADHLDFIRHFEAEAQLVARLEHPYIVPLYDYWREPGVAYLVMRLLRGGSLRDALKNGPLALEVVTVLLEQIGAALHAAHRVGVIHRDLKPANVLMDEDGNGYLADFGIAKNLSNPDMEDLTQAGAIVGSPAYTSPEQIRSELVKPQADIYCLGILVYELLSGDKPFQGPTPVDYIMQHLNEALPPLPAHPALDPIIQRATAKDPLDRYPDIPSLLADFRQAVTAQSAMIIPEIPHGIALLDGELENPYKGLRPFGEADADDFFGRETLIQELLTRMSEADEQTVSSRQDLGRFLAVVGPSGSGKSSAVKAGLIPALRRGGLPGSENWFIVDLIPGAHPLEELEAALLRVAVNPPESLLAQLRESERGLLQAVRRVLPADPNVELVLIIDQFEEVFTQVADEAVRAHLLDSLLTAVLDERSRVRVVVTLRADFTDRPLSYVDFGELVRQRTAFVLPLSPDELEQAIVGPAARVGMVVEPGLVATMVQDVGDQPGMLPLLQYALTELFERREGHTLTLAAYQESGGVTGALTRRAEELYVGLGEPAQACPEGSRREAARQLFLRLVTLGEGVEDTRRRVLRTELSALQTSEVSETSEVLDKVIDLYGRYRLLTFDHDPVTRGPTVEVAHEALLREWSRLRDWLDESRTDVRMQRLLAAATAEWDIAGREPSYLLRGARLAQFESWAEGSAVALTQDERAYLETSTARRKARQTEEAERQQRELETAQKLAESEGRRAQVLKRGAMALAGVSLIAIVLAVVAFLARQQALRQASIGLGAQALIELEGPFSERAVLLALEALENYPYTPQAERALGQAVLGSRLRLILQHEDQVNSAQWSPDGTCILTASDDNTAKVWDAITGEKLLTLSGHRDIVMSAVWSPSGNRILTASQDRTVRVWDATASSPTYGEELLEITGHFAGVNSAWWSPDGTRILTASGDGTAKVWDAETGEELVLLSGHRGHVRSAAWSPSGKRILTASGDGTARVWNAATGDSLLTLSGHTDSVFCAAWSPDGLRIVTGSADGTARVWDATTGTEILIFSKHQVPIYAVAWSSDGSRIVTGGRDAIARVWDATTGAEILTLRGHTANILGLAWSPDGSRIVTASVDGTAKVWDLDPANLTITGPEGPLVPAAWSPAGDRVARSFMDGTVKVWNAVTGEEIVTLAGYSRAADITWSPSGDRMATAGSDGTIKVWDANTGEEFITFFGHSGSVYSARWSPDGTRIVSAGGNDGTIRIWDADTGVDLLTFAGHSGGVTFAGWSPDGRTIVSSSYDGTVKIWEATTGQLIRNFYPEDFGYHVYSLDWSPDGAHIAAWAGDGIVRVWNVATGEEMVAFSGHTGDVWVVNWSPTGERILTGGGDGTVRVWDASTGAELLRYEFESGLIAVWSPDGSRIAVASTDGSLKVLPTWQTTQELVDYAKECCVIRELTTEEREQYGLRSR